MNYLLKSDKPCDQAIPPLQYTQKQTHTLVHQNICTTVLKCFIYICQKLETSIKWINKLWYIYTMGHT